MRHSAILVLVVLVACLACANPAKDAAEAKVAEPEAPVLPNEGGTLLPLAESSKIEWVGSKVTGSCGLPRDWPGDRAATSSDISSKKNPTGTSRTRDRSNRRLAPIRFTPFSFFWIC